MTGWIVNPISRSGERGSRTRFRSAITSVSGTKRLMPPPPRARRRTVALLVGELAAGQGQEHVVERRPADGDVVGVDPGLVEAASRLHDRALLAGDANAHPSVVDGGLLLGHRSERHRGIGGARGVGEVDLDAEAADPLLELVGGPVGDHPPAVDDRDPIGETIRLVEVLRGQKDGRAFGDEALDRLPELEPAARIEAGGRLVEEEDRRVGDERGGEVEAAAHSTRVGLRDPPAGVAEAEAVEQLVGPSAGFGAALAVEAADHDEVLDRRSGSRRRPRTGRRARSGRGAPARRRRRRGRSRGRRRRRAGVAS